MENENIKKEEKPIKNEEKKVEEKKEVKLKKEKEQGTFKLEIYGHDIQQYIKNLGKFLDEAILKINDKGLRIISSDRAMVCVCDLRLPKTEFKEFQINDNTDGFNLGISMTFLSTLLSKINSTDSKPKVVTFEYDKKGRFWIKFDNSQFLIPILDITDELPPIEELTFKTKIKVDADELQRIVDYAGLVSDSLVIKTDGTVLMEAIGDINSMVSKLDKPILKGENSKARYPIDYLSKLKFVGEKITIDYANSYPMRLRDKFFTFILAPRVSE